MSVSTVSQADYRIDVARVAAHPLDAIFTPETVAVIGASEQSGSVGRTVLTNLIRTPFGGTVFPVNPKRTHVLGIKTYPRVADVPAPIDLAVVITPAPSVPDVIGECADCGVRGRSSFRRASRRPARRAPRWSGRSWNRHVAGICA